MSLSENCLLSFNGADDNFKQGGLINKHEIIYKNSVVYLESILCAIHKLRNRKEIVGLNFINVSNFYIE